MAWIGLEDVNITGVEGIMAFPLTGDPYFWGKILLGLWIILVSGFYFEERKRLGKGNILSAMAVSSLAIIVLAFAGSLFDIVTGEVFVSTLVACLVLIVIWFIRK